MKFLIFDICGKPYKNLTFEECVVKLQEIIPKSDNNIKIVEFVKCRDINHMNQFLIDIMNQGGEGIMIRKPGSTYEKGRNSSIQKYKPSFTDLATTISPQSPSKTMKVKSFFEITFYLYNRISEQKYGLLKIGDCIEYRFNALTNYGTPRTPTIKSQLNFQPSKYTSESH